MILENEESDECEDLSFSVVLKKSHIDQMGHGVVCFLHKRFYNFLKLKMFIKMFSLCFQYMPPLMWPICREWGKKTTVSLSLGEQEWDVQVLRSKNVFRFGIGWNNFTFDNNLQVGQVILFQFMGSMSFQVTIEA